ncbi:MAG TPA: hypothetical protein VEB21_18045, partial [Terriglobales bacterium]|nr:hypothetical protein [Terriglobales bacterium]
MNPRPRRPAMLLCVATLGFWTLAHRDAAPLQGGTLEVLLMCAVAVVFVISGVLAVAAARERRWLVLLPLLLWLAGLWLRLGAVPQGVLAAARARGDVVALPPSLAELMGQIMLTGRWATGLAIGSLVIGWLANPTPLLERGLGWFRRRFERRFESGSQGETIFWPYGRQWAMGRVVPDTATRELLWQKERDLWLVVLYFGAVALLCRGLADLALLSSANNWPLLLSLATLPALVLLVGGVIARHRHHDVALTLAPVPAAGAIAASFRRAARRHGFAELRRKTSVAALAAAAASVAAVALQASGAGLGWVMLVAAAALWGWMYYLWC